MSTLERVGSDRLFDFFSTLSKGRISKKKGLILLRWLLVIVTSYLIIFGEKTFNGEALIFLFILSNLLLSYMPDRIFYHPRFDYIIVISDTLLVSVGIYYAGLVNSDFFLIYFFVVMIAMFGQTFKLIVFNTCIVILIYSVLIFRATGFSELTNTQFFIRIPFLFIVSLFYGFLVEMLKNERIKAETIAIENRRLLDLNEKKTDFLNTVAHDIRTPLTTIKSYADLMIDYEDMQGSQKDFLTIISGEVDRMAILINDFLSISRIESGQIDYKFKGLNLSEVIPFFLGPLSPQFESKGIEQILRLEENLPLVKADSEKIGQVITNILTNAAKFTPKGGRVIVEAKKLGDQEVVVSVSDNGPGIPSDVQGMIFNKYYQVNDSDIRAKGGNGLGLAIAKMITNHHGGRIWVESKTGQGSTFSFSLPIYENT